MNANKKWDVQRIYDFLIIGTGMGGSSVAYALRNSAASILMIERGDFIPQEKENWSVKEVSLKKRYAAKEEWKDNRGKTFKPRIYYNVGGNTKFFGATSFRLRKSDFSEEWPLEYRDLSPWYKQAELLMGVRGESGIDPSEPEDQEYELPYIEHEPSIQELSDRLTSLGYHPFHLPIAVDSGLGGKCRKGSPCDGFPCLVRAKGDAENSFIRPLLVKTDMDLTLLTNAKVEKIIQKECSNEIDSVEIRIGDKKYIQKGRTIILAAGAINSAALLLSSANPDSPRGIGNSSGQVGCNYMAHNNTVIMAISPFKKNTTRFQKTLAINDFYSCGWGNIQLRGKVKKEMLQSKKNLLFRIFKSYISKHSVDLWLMTEDRAMKENRLNLSDSSQICLEYQINNSSAHKKLIRAASRMMRQAGYPIILKDKRGIEAVQHQCGTIRMGNNEKDAPLDQWCRSYDHPNLFVVDASFFPRSGAVNPALTIAAMGLRVGDYLQKGFSTDYK
jgi:choline dehydrogenase-like flavoprotein